MSIPFLSGFGLDDGRARLAALDRSLATIAFSLDGVIVDANENFLTTTGYAIDEIRGRHHRMFVRPEDAQSADYEAFWGRLRDGGTESGEFQRVGAGGRAVWLQASYTPVFDRRGRPAGVVKIAIDVTAQKTLDADRTGQLAAIDRSQAVIEFDLEGRILRANDNFLQAAGYRLDEIVGRPHAMFVDPEEAAGAPYRAFWQALARGEPQAGEFRRKRRDGRDLWLQAVYSPIRDAGGVCRKVVKYASDVTAEKETRADAESQLAAVNRAQAVIQFDVEGRVLDANENFLTAVGYSMREIAGQHHAMFVEPSHAQSADYAEFWAKLRRGELVAGMFQRMAKSGRPIWIQASYNPVFGPGGELVKIVKFATDVTGSMGARQTAVSTAEQALDNVEQISHAAEGLKAAADDITTSMSRSREAVDEIERRSREAVTMTGRLSDAARSMDGVVAAISTIASQINLLSLNATIEAARAGEAGRGFTVVAAEVKNLADQAATATARIGVEIAGVQGVSSEVVGQLAAIAGSVDQISTNVGEVAALVDEQGRSTADMLVNVRQAAASFSSIATSLDEWTVGIEERRSEKRTRVLYAATIQAAGGREIPCIVRDISAGGARIELRSLESLPPVFVLALEGDGRRMSCELKVQDGLEARVRFTGAASRAA